MVGIISVKGLCKRYGAPDKPPALADLDVEVNEGEVYSLLGPNGAGKTSLIGVLCGLLPPTAGEVRVGGYSVVHEPMAVKRIIGVVPEEVALYHQLSGRRNLRYFAALYGLRGTAQAQAVDAALDDVGLTAVADKRVSHYSNGMRRRLNIAAALLHGPRVLLMDEPTLGLDPDGRRTIIDLVRRLRQQSRVTILYTTHYMAEAEEISDRVGIIHQGRLIAEGTPAELVRTLEAEETLRLHVAEAGGISAEAVAALGRATGVRRVAALGDTVTMGVVGVADVLPGILTVAREAGISVRSLTVQHPDLEAVFLRLTGRALDDPPAAASGYSRPTASTG